MEHAIIDLWQRQDTFARSLDRPDAPQWTFYEGPPTANGVPGTHHIESRAFKDVFPRFKTMQGYRVPRKAGWDCHGLPVELAVEKELGFAGKPDIERYGIEAFNAKCRQSVSRYVDLWSQLTRRMGFWVNLDEAYWTMSPQFVQSVWWALKQIHSAGLLIEDYRVTPYCPRCGTTLSDHELAQGYEEVEDTTAFVRLPLIDGPWAGRAALLIWTTTPWTLVSNVAAAVHPDVAYVAASDGRETLIVAEALRQAVLGADWQVVGRFQGREMVRWHYARPFDSLDLRGADANYVITADYVTVTDGTGVVHQAPAFGAEDMESCRSWNLPFVNPITPDGQFADGLPVVGGLFFASADGAVLSDLEQRQLLFRVQKHLHPYPHCWRCGTRLIYYAQPSWYIRTTARKADLLRENQATNWYPGNIKYGRYGDWLNHNIDWALSRQRYWGTPLPVWRCPDDHQICVGSLAELSQLSGQDHLDLDPHRPFVDAVTFPCPTCGQTASRVPEVIDAWFDSGSMPFGQWGYPWAEGSAEAFERAFPGDFICEAIDQTRGWFYSLMAVSTLVFGRNSYKNVLCLGHILAEDGRKMSKHLGNILEPLPLLEQHGADAVRWFMLAGGSPWAARQVGHHAIQEAVRKVLLTYWNAVSFQGLYAAANHWAPGDRPLEQRPPEQRHVLDRWLLSATGQLIRQVTAALEDFDTLRAGVLLSGFVDDLSNWHIRRSRRRFWAGDDSALATLHQVLDVLTRLMAPITPFLTERVWQDLFVATDPAAPDSVHLASWPTPDPAWDDPGLMADMELTRRLVELGRAARSAAQVKVRQPLARLLVSGAALERLDDDLLAEIKAEINVVAVGSFASAGDLVDHSVKANFRALGRRFGPATAAVAAAVAQADAAQVAADLARDGRVTIIHDGGPVELTADEVIVSERPRQGWSVVNEQGETVALDLELTDELVRQGLAREFIRSVQESRKAAGLKVSDRIKLAWMADGAMALAIAEAHDQIAAEVLAVVLAPGQPPADWFPGQAEGAAYALAKA
jgi:isoleucyl-tRNA synthetase